MLRLIAALLLCDCAAALVPPQHRHARRAARPAARMAATVASDVLYRSHLNDKHVFPDGDSPLPAVGERFRKGVKQVSTLGPASFDPEMIEKLFLEGTDVFRLNLSHRGPGLLETAKHIRAIEKKYDHPIGILADLQGPKHRVGSFDEKVELRAGQKFRFDLDVDSSGNTERAALPHPEVLAALKIGDPILLDDGKLRVEVVEKAGDNTWVETVVKNDAALNSRKGFNLPATLVPGEAMTPKDIEDLEFLMSPEFVEVGVDWIALSFVQQPADIVELRERVAGRSPAMLLAKIEKPSAVADLGAIIDEVDGIMVARGDLGVEMPPEDVPIIQKDMIDACRNAGKPIIVATQMLESMIESPAPTRAECSDVSTAIFDGCDAVMLSGESAAGKYPEESVRVRAERGGARYISPLFPPESETLASLAVAAGAHAAAARAARRGQRAPRAHAARAAPAARRLGHRRDHGGRALARALVRRARDALLHDLGQLGAPARAAAAGHADPRAHAQHRDGARAHAALVGLPRGARPRRAQRAAQGGLLRAARAGHRHRRAQGAAHRADRPHGLHRGPAVQDARHRERDPHRRARRHGLLWRPVHGPRRHVKARARAVSPGARAVGMLAPAVFSIPTPV